MRKGADLMKSFGTTFSPGWPDATLLVGEGKKGAFVMDTMKKWLFEYAGYKAGNEVSDAVTP
jgi:hypothetical protein